MMTDRENKEKEEVSFHPAEQIGQKKAAKVFPS